jgi:HEAT repeat protein
VAAHPVTGIPSELSAEELAAQVSNSPEAQLERVAAKLLGSESLPRQDFIKCFSYLTDHIHGAHGERAFKILESILHQIPESSPCSEVLLVATDKQVVAAVVLNKAPCGAYRLRELLDESPEPTVRSAILRLYQGNLNEELRQIFRDLLKADHELVRLSALGALLDCRMDQPIYSKDFFINKEPTVEEAKDIARYVMLQMPYDVKTLVAENPHSPDRRLNSVRDHLLAHQDVQVREFLISAALGRQGQELAAGACGILLRDDDSACKAAVAESYRDDVGDVRTKLFAGVRAKEALSEVPNEQLELEAARVFVDSSEKKDARENAFSILCASGPEKYHQSFCKVFKEDGLATTFVTDLAVQMKKNLDAEALGAATSVLITPPQSLWETVRALAKKALEPKRGHLEGYPPREHHKAAAIGLLSCGEHPLKQKALRSALSSESPLVRWAAVVALGVSDPSAKAALKKFSPREFSQYFSLCVLQAGKALTRNELTREQPSPYQARLDDSNMRFVSEVASPHVAKTLKGLATTTRPLFELHGLGDVLAMRINAGRAEDLKLIIDFFKMTASNAPDKPYHLSEIVGAFCLRALAKVDGPLSPKMLAQVSQAVQEAELDKLTRETADKILKGMIALSSKAD